ncbi:MAG TPA: glycosyl hydrolase family 28-related protein, partial [Gemmata sp.]|nr:glycosyl hydrolase family 28-related protein [Gemmata sp.]
MTRRLVFSLFFLAVAIATAVAWNVRTEQVPNPPRVAASSNVRDHGAKGDASDDTQAIQKAINSAGLLGLVQFPKGTYRITRTITIDLAKTGPIVIRGDGPARIINAADGPAFQFIGTHAGTADPKTVKPAVWNERMPRMEGLEIVGEHTNGDGIEAAGTMQLTIDRVLIRKCRHGIHLTGRNRNVIIANSHIYENRGIGIFLDAVNLHQMNVTACHVSYCDDGGIVCK